MVRRQAVTVARLTKVGAYRQTLVGILPLVVTVALLLVGLWMCWPTVEYDGPATQDAYNQFSFDRFAYSDIASLYFRNGLLLRIGGCILEQARIELPRLYRLCTECG